MAMSCTRHSQNTASTSLGHNRTAQKAADSDLFRSAVQRATTHRHICRIHQHLQHCARQQTIHTPCPRPTPPSHTTASPYLPPPWRHLHNDTTCNRHKGAGVNADSIDIFIDGVNANIPYVPTDLNFIFNQIYQNNLPPESNCLHKDPNDKTKLHPLGIPTAIRRLMASHAAHTFREKFAQHMLPFNIQQHQ